MLTVAGTDAAEVLKSKDFDVLPFADHYRALGIRLGLDFGAILHTLEIAPLALNGPEHLVQRSDMARLIADARPGLIAALPGIVAKHFACLGQTGTHDLVGQAIVPTMDAVIGELIGFDAELTTDSLISRAFSGRLGVAQRIRMNAELADLIARIKNAFPDDTDLRRASRLGLVVLGRDATIGSLGLSMLDYLASKGETLAVPPSHSSVPFVPRKSNAPTVLRGEPFAQDEIVRCQLQSGDPAMDRATFFGTGPHMCVGRVLTMDIFQVLSRYLAGLPNRWTVLESVKRDCDVFVVLKTLKVKVT